MMEIAMRMPDLGTVDDTIKVVKWLVEVGQPIRRGQPIVEVETDKSILELESTTTGKLQAIAVPAGSEAAAGEVIATFAVDAEPRSEAVATEVTKSVVAMFDAAPAAPPPDRPVAAPISVGPRLSSFEKNRRVPTESAPVPNAADYSPDFMLDLYRRMV
jgi:pyruvate dehydrogenase E2 component (dihydrolipoamide acetyltransferase)